MSIQLDELKHKLTHLLWSSGQYLVEIFSNKGLHLINLHSTINSADSGIELLWYGLLTHDLAI